MTPYRRPTVNLPLMPRPKTEDHFGNKMDRSRRFASKGPHPSKALMARYHLRTHDLIIFPLSPSHHHLQSPPSSSPPASSNDSLPHNRPVSPRPFSASHSLQFSPQQAHAPDAALVVICQRFSRLQRCQQTISCGGLLFVARFPLRQSWPCTLATYSNHQSLNLIKARNEERRRHTLHPQAYPANQRL